MAVTSNTDTIGTIYKNQSEDVHVTLGEFAGHQLVGIRVFFRKEGDVLPGKAGLSMRVSAIPELIAVLQKAEAEAIRRGILKPTKVAA